ncbi:NADPH:quinone reductase [Actinoplanes sp. L3-i22]|uniref:NADPH:quinone reductase n=1 Tax=Actinoplanes sp. L3-i22 TaxID=2836373 RepID=UPI001C77073E|nr:NADPH:quinone reductase [Actinoplanes sp. L3-i22]BCY12171.1 NADPH:quinone reductase [Actinoplanes sp. L3-i22]
MRAIVFDNSTLRLTERTVPEPGDGEIRVRVIRSGVNPTDWKRVATSAPGSIPNMDGAGIVDAVGPGVLSHHPGDRVWVMLAAHTGPFGTAAEFCVVPAAHAFPLPEPFSFDEGAALGVPAITAHRALTVAEAGPGRLAPGALTGRTVLVAGGAGAVGHAAIQLARWAGATVVTTVSSPEKAELATAAGAHHVVDYRATDAATAIRAVAPDGVDVIAEVAVAQNAQLNQAVAANHATIAIYANNGGDTAAFDIRPHMMINARIQFLILYTVGEPALQAAAEDVGAALRDGVLGIGTEHGLPLHHFPLDRTADAHAAVEKGAIGKVLLTLD